MGARKDAMTRGENTYFTGKACSHGHITYRYTQSGSCSACVNANSYRFREDGPTGTLASPLVAFRCRIHPKDIPTVLDTAVAMTQRRHPSVARYQVVRNEKGRHHAAGVGLFELNVDAEDVAVLREMVNALLSAACAGIRAPVLPSVPRDPTWNERFGAG